MEAVSVAGNKNCKVVHGQVINCRSKEDQLQGVKEFCRLKGGHTILSSARAKAPGWDAKTGFRI